MIISVTVIFYIPLQAFKLLICLILKKISSSSVMYDTSKGNYVGKTLQLQ